MKVLFVTYGLPNPPYSGARLRDFFLVRALAKRHQVTCACLLDAHDDPTTAERALAPFGIMTMAIPLKETADARAKTVVRHVRAGYPPATLAFWNARFFDAVQELTAREAFDAVQIEHSFLVPYVEALPKRFMGTTLLDLHNISMRQYGQMSELALGARARVGFWLKAHALKDWELEWAKRFRRVLRDDAKWLESHAPTLDTVVIENGADTEGCAMLPPPTRSRNLLFVGALGYAPNVDGLQWFCDEILPQVQEQVPDAALVIAGRAPNARVRELAQRRGVELEADVTDLRPLYEQATLALAPLRAGGGTRLKILEAMAFGRAVVSTRIGSDGLDVCDGETIALADTAEDFAQRIVQLLGQPEERQQTVQNARRLVERCYAWERIGAKLLDVYEETAAK